MTAYSTCCSGWCGAVNLCAPHPLPNAGFMRGLREAWGARFGLPAAEWMLEIGWPAAARDLCTRWRDAK